MKIILEFLKDFAHTNNIPKLKIKRKLRLIIKIKRKRIDI